MAVMLCLVIILAFGLGYTMGRNDSMRAGSSVQQESKSYGRFGHMPDDLLKSVTGH